MGHTSLPCGRTPTLDRVFDLLCQYLNFGDDYPGSGKAYLRYFLTSKYVRPFFDEYVRDYLTQADEIEDIGLQEVADWCRLEGAFNSPTFFSRRTGSKRGWARLDHAARFIVQALRYSWANNGPWSHGSWEASADGEEEVEFWQCWLVLRYLQAEWEAANLDDWDESGVNEMFLGVQLGKL